MAMELSCLAGVDEDEKDADSEINAFTLLQDPERMAQESAAGNNSFNTGLLKQNSVLDVLSNADLLSPIGLGNGPSLHEATQTHEHNSNSSEKDEEKSITQLKTVQEIDPTGIWEFDDESPENSLDNFSNANDLSWDPHKEFMQFLWENHNESPGEEPKDELSSSHNQRKRKRKMDMVVMVDPSEDLYPEISPQSSEEASDAEVLLDSNPVRIVKNSRNLTKPQSPPIGKVPKYPNGTVKTIKKILYTTPPKNSHDINHGISPLKERLAMHSEEEGFPCSKCSLTFKKEYRLLRHMKSHEDPAGLLPKSFICRECGESFRQSNSLIDHMAVHKNRAKVTEEIKPTNNKTKEDGNPKFFCPQCPFATNCANTFVQHAKTHEKDKYNYRCGKCTYRCLSASELRKHDLLQHTIITVKKPMQGEDQSGIYPCSICSYKAFSKNVFQNHLMRRHQLTFEEYAAIEYIETNTSKELQVSTYKDPDEDTEFTSKISIKNRNSKAACSPDESNDILDLFKSSKIKRGPRSQLSESKLDKSINVLLSRQSHGKKGSENETESNNCGTNTQVSHSDDNGKDESPELPVQVESSSTPTNGPKSNVNDSLVKKSPSKRKMSTPFRNTSEQDSCFILPKPLPSPKKVNPEEESPNYDEIDPFQDSDGSCNFFGDRIKKEKKSIIYTYSRRMSMRGAIQASKRLFEKIKSEEREQSEPEIKEECIETEIYQEGFDPHQIPLGESSTDDLLDLEQKNCPYCPAIFESGVGLSNHVRGHLHRVGLSYNARHVVPPEQVASHDKKPRIRRKLSALRQLKKALQLESESETVKGIHSCPLCGDTFDNRTGQSNHIRGHLKKLGRCFSTKTKSPLVLLRELMRDKKECQRALQILGKRRNHFQFGASPKLHTTNRFTHSTPEPPKSPTVSSVCADAEPLLPSFPLTEIKSEKSHVETMSDVKNSLSGTTALIGILKKRKCQEDARIKGSSSLQVSSNSEQSSGSRVASSLPNSASEKGEFNRKVCIHCNATFHSGVSLSNHLRAYAKRQRVALLEGTTIDCKAVRTRSRPGSKKKTLPLTQTPEEMYRLTCRFCDLVFQGPLSVQEDWIKHLQRHIMNTGVPHSGLGMVEVPMEPQILQTDEDSSSPLAASSKELH